MAFLYDSPSMTDPGFAAEIEETESGGRSFWLGLAGGWLAYLVITVSAVAAFEDVPLSEVLIIGVVNVVPPALVSVVVALNRRRLLRPEWGLARTLAVHVVVGLAFAVVTSTLALTLMPSGGAFGELADASYEVRFAAIMMSYLFLYAVFFGFLMWSESIRRVQSSHRVAAREAVLRAEAEAKAIRAQFNPHFVFNTLHSLMLLVRADPTTAERAIEDVATLIRYASIVQRRDIDSVVLAKELEVARRYVDLERLRLEDRLRVSWSIDVDPGAVTIPAFALQTLVENAIRHGIEPRTRGGSVRIDVRAEGGSLIVTVADDGRGADPGVIETSKGRGLVLLRERLESRYGSEGHLEYDTSPDGGFTVVLRLPVEAPTPTAALNAITERPREDMAATEDLVDTNDASIGLGNG